ncbi:MAG: dockerin type I domain-containing protein, partial [Fidelibacterota bacterium]
HYDDCGICCDGNTGIECSYWNGPDDFGGSMDCTGICFGSAVIDACEICAGGDTGLEPNYCDEEMDGMICWGEYSGPDFDNCGECFGNTRTPDCTGTCFGTAFENECGCVGGSTGLAPDFCYGCTDPEAVNYDPDATIDDGSCITDFDVYLYISDVTESSIEISMVNNEMVFGFQFTIMSSPELGAIFSDASGGLAQQYGFMMSTNSEGVVLGFSLTGGFIPVGSGVLTNVSWSHSGSAGYLTLDQMIFSGVGGSAFNTETGDSYQIGSGYDVYGCTDPEALNYDPYANLDDGSCIYDESISQSIDLTSEHLNWVSFHVYPDQSDIRIIFQPLIDNSSLISVNGSNGGGLYLSNSEWINTIGNIEIDEVYMVHINFDTQFQVQGELIQLPVSSYLSEGLNMIGYPLNVSQSVTGVFQPFIDAGIILSISNDLGQMIIPEYGISQFDEFIPGEGYNISVNTPMVVRFCENQSDCNSIIYGCTEMTACNYNPEATIDDGTCWDCVIGDVNFDGSFDILDVVAIVSIIMGTQPYNPAADLNGDGNVDALDIVSVISIILGTGEPPGVTETANVQFTENSACFVADFTVQVLQMTIQHGEDFELTINENAQEAEYETQGNFTTINFVLPEGPELFVTNNAFVIEEVQVSSQAGYAEVEVYYGSCGSEPEFIFGCTDEGSCNFEPEAMIDNGSCEYFDCFGDCGGNALEDECGACCDGNTGAECSWYNGIDDFGGVYDCAGFCYGPAYLGEDGYCYINPADAGSYPYDDDFWD